MTGGGGDDARAAPDPRESPADMLRKCAGLEPTARAAALMDWILERVGASRCALVPFDGGSPGPPVAARVRGVRPGDLNPRKVPRAILDHVARTRQPLFSSDVGRGDALPPSTTMEHQLIGSYLAVPVVFRGELLAACYADRLGQPGDFDAADRAAFEAFAYEMALPLLGLREEARRREYEALRDAALVPEPGLAPVVAGRTFQAVLDRARLLAPHVDENLLILGESGSGKELVARQVHAWSARPGRFVAINLAAIPGELFESELMGARRGAYTGAIDKPGRILEADRGTLFLDEIGDLPLLQQVKLLRFLQERTVVPVGGTTERRVDVRVIAATNRPVAKLMASGEFREDLFHRFAPPLVVPPLRERREDILALAERWLAAKARARGMQQPVLADDARGLLVAHDWLGNVRQLESVLSHALLLAPGPHLDRAVIEPLLGQAAPPGGALPRSWSDWQALRLDEERRWLEAALERHGGVAELAARDAGCPASTFRYLMRRHGLTARPRGMG